MKNFIKTVCLILLFAELLVLFGCKGVVGKKSHVPVVSDIRIATSISNLSNGITVTKFKVNKTYYLGFSVYDEDLDVSKAYVKQTRVSDGYIIPEMELNLSKQNGVDVTYHTSFLAEYTGTWIVEIYVLDEDGNKSNAASRTFIVESNVPSINNLRLIDANGITPTKIKKFVAYKFCFDLIDEDLDASVAKVSITKPGELPVDVDINLSKQNGKSVTYYIDDYFDIAGLWLVEVYVVDKEKNISNKLYKSFYVTE